MVKALDPRSRGLGFDFVVPVMCGSLWQALNPHCLLSLSIDENLIEWEQNVVCGSSVYAPLY